MSARIDMAGLRFGALTALKRSASNARRWSCRCDCGVELEVDGCNLRAGHSKSCGCRKRETPQDFRPLSGRFGRLVTVRRATETGVKPVKYLVRCDCGGEAVVAASKLRSGHTRSCGCLASEVRAARWRTHGKTDTRVYRAWASMLRRCQNPNTVAYKWYGARGIKTCERWQKFENFLADMGEPPVGMELDRIDNDGNYEPENCRWVTHQKNCMNRRNNVRCN